MRRLKATLTLLAVLAPLPALASWVDGVASIMESYYQAKYAYLLTASGLWIGALSALGRMRGGERFSPPVAKAVSFTLYAICFVCCALVTVHFLPTISSIFDWIGGVLERIFE